MKTCILCKKPQDPSQFKIKLNGKINACCNRCLDLTREIPPVVAARIRMPQVALNPTPDDLLRKAAEKAYREIYKKSGKATYGKYKARAAKKGLPFELTLEQFLLILNQNCHYCNAAPRGGVDRRDSNEGYTLANSLPSCKRCNLAKNDMSYDDFLVHIGAIHSWLLT
jgi:hypothetical protein